MKIIGVYIYENTFVSVKYKHINTNLFVKYKLYFGLVKHIEPLNLEHGIYFLLNKSYLSNCSKTCGDIYRCNYWIIITIH